MKIMRKYAILILSLTCIYSCSPLSPRDAVEVVECADSVRATGGKYSDTIALENAYASLSDYKVFFPLYYTRACYHYGRLLVDNAPIEAMKCFIEATQMNTDDYEILGRVYNNIGEICNKAEDYELAYDMFGNAANHFLSAEDTTRYEKALLLQSSMLTNLDEHARALEMLQDISTSSTNTEIQHDILPIKSTAFLSAGQYDSAIYYIKEYFFAIETDSLKRLPILETISFLESLLTLYEKSEEENTIDWNEIMSLISNQRAEIADKSFPSDEQYLQAAHLLRSDLQRTRAMKWVYKILMLLSIVAIAIVIYLMYQARRHALLSQKIHTATDEYSDIQAERLKNIENTAEIIRSSANIQKELSWREFEKMCEVVDTNFYLLAGKLKQQGVLNETELRLCVLIFIGLSHDEIAKTLPYARNSIGKLKDQTAKKLQTTGRNLRNYLIDLAKNV